MVLVVFGVVAHSGTEAHGSVLLYGGTGAIDPRSVSTWHRRTDYISGHKLAFNRICQLH